MALKDRLEKITAVKHILVWKIEREREFIDVQPIERIVKTWRKIRQADKPCSRAGVDEDSRV